VEKLDMLPSEYWHRNCYLGASQMVSRVVETRDVVGVDRIMWGADYPHHEGTWPHGEVALRLNFGAVPEPEVREMTSGVAARVYGFDLEFLQTVADRVGPTVERIATPVADDEIPRHTMCHTFVEAEQRIAAASAQPVEQPA
jgi:Amidohydrolase